MAYDPLRRVHVYLEPADAQAPGQPQRVWEWDGLTWADRTPPVMPPSRLGGDLAYDPVNRGVLLFGGSSVAPYFPPPLLDTWLWDGASWRDMQPVNHPVSPTAISNLHLLTDTNRNRVLLYSQHMVYSGAPTVWIWDGADWSPVPGSAYPTPWRDAFSLTFDTGRDRIVMTGGFARVGSGGSYVNVLETWEFDGTAWSRLPTTSAPPCMLGSLVYDPIAERVLLVGGVYWASNCFNYDVWELRTPTPASYIEGAPGCLGTSGTPSLGAAPGSRPWLGDRFDVDLGGVSPGATALMATGFSMSSWGPHRLPLDLSFVGAPGCALRVAPSAWYPFQTGTSGAVRWSLGIPNDPALAGTRFHNQALVLEPAANALGAVLSNAATGITGIR
jgi:hypothetical protein